MRLMYSGRDFAWIDQRQLNHPNILIVHDGRSRPCLPVRWCGSRARCTRCRAGGRVWIWSCASGPRLSPLSGVTGRRLRMPGNGLVSGSIDYRHFLFELARKPQAVRQVLPDLLWHLGCVFGDLGAAARGPRTAGGRPALREGARPARHPRRRGGRPGAAGRPRDGDTAAAGAHRRGDCVERDAIGPRPRWRRLRVNGSGVAPSCRCSSAKPQRDRSARSPGTWWLCRPGPLRDIEVASGCAADYDSWLVEVAV